MFSIWDLRLGPSIINYNSVINFCPACQQIIETYFDIYCGIYMVRTNIIMTLNDFLLPVENVKFYGKCPVEYSGKKYKLLMTDHRIILFAKRGHIHKSNDIVSERLDRLHGLEYSEKGFLFRKAKICIQGTEKLEIYGPVSELKILFSSAQKLVNLH